MSDFKILFTSIVNRLKTENPGTSLKLESGRDFIAITHGREEISITAINNSFDCVMLNIVGFKYNPAYDNCSFLPQYLNETIKKELSFCSFVRQLVAYADLKGIKHGHLEVGYTLLDFNPELVIEKEVVQAWLEFFVELQNSKSAYLLKESRIGSSKPEKVFEPAQSKGKLDCKGEIFPTYEMKKYENVSTISKKGKSNSYELQITHDFSDEKVKVNVDLVSVSGAKKEVVSSKLLNRKDLLSMCYHYITSQGEQSVIENIDSLQEVANSPDAVKENNQSFFTTAKGKLITLPDMKIITALFVFARDFFPKQRQAVAKVA